jgi:hypothetical protein
MFIISFSDAIGEKWAVVIKPFHAIITDTAMG